jgi:hypothetical protein
MNALERIEDQQTKLDTLAERVFEIHEILQRILPITDALVSVVGRDAVLEAAKKHSEQQRNTHVAELLSSFEQRTQDGSFVEGEQVEANSVLFVNEARDESQKDLRVLPVEALNDDFRSKILGAKKGFKLESGPDNETIITIERIFTPAAPAAE